MSILSTALSSAAAKAVILISTIGQLFCGMACVTSASRMAFAFSRDGAIPGHRLWRRLGVQRHADLRGAVRVPDGPDRHHPGLLPQLAGYPVAFFAVTSIAVIGLYIAYTIPVFLRWRMGDRFQPGPWTLGRHYRWINPIAFIWVGLCVIIFCLPRHRPGVFFKSGFSWGSVNYAPIVTIVVMLAVTIWYLVSARRTFTGPVRTIEFADDGITVAEPEPGVA